MITFRVLKKVLKKFVREKHISIKTFDLKSIKIYECRGKDLLGNNVKTNVDYKIFSLNDRYLIYEIPSKLNKNKIEGSFLWYIMNIENYKSYLFLLNYNINYKLSFERLKLIDDVYIYYFGKLSKSKEKNKLSNEQMNTMFDGSDKRKHAYYISSREIIDNLITMKIKEREKLILRKNYNLICKMRKPIF